MKCWGFLTNYWDNHKTICPLLIKPTNNHMKTQYNSNHKYIIVSLIKLYNCVICIEHEEYIIYKICQL